MLKFATGDVVETVAQAAVPLELKWLSMGNSAFKGHAEALGLIVQHFRAETLDLCECEMGSACVVSISRHLQQVKKLDLREGNVGDEGVQALAAAIERGSALEELKLESNPYADAGISALAKAIVHENCKLKELDVSNNGARNQSVLVAAFQSPASRLQRLRGHSGTDGAAAANIPRTVGKTFVKPL